MLQLLQGGDLHDNVEEIVEALVDSSYLYKITPWYGCQLFDMAPVPETYAKPIFKQLFRAVAFLHNRQQLLLSPQGKHGKECYMSPDLSRDEAFDPEGADVWAMGTMLFMVLLGVQPWKAVGDKTF
ncbi:unnamed protein product, partial [Discosporangium mesarthrocarpum]